MVLYTIVFIIVVGLFYLLSKKLFNCDKKRVHWRDEDGNADLESVKYIPCRDAIKKYEDLPEPTVTLDNIDLPDTNKLANVPESKIQERTMYIEIPDYELMDYKPRKIFDMK